MYTNVSMSPTDGTNQATSYSYGSTINPLSFTSNKYEITFGVIALLCALWSTPTNLLAFVQFFRIKKVLLSKAIFLLLALSDALCCLTLLPVALSFLSMDRQPLILANPLICNAVGLIWNVSSRMSVILVASLAVVRAIFSKFPFRATAYKSTIISAANCCIGLFVVCYTLKSLCPYVFGAQYHYSQYLVMCDFYFDDISAVHTLGYKVLFVVYLTDYIWPILPIVAGCLGTVHVLVRQHMSATSPATLPHHRKRKRSRLQSKTVTILLVILTYLAFNLPLVAVYLYQIVADFSGDRDNYSLLDDIQISLYVMPLVAVLAVGINGSCNSVIYFKRFPNMGVSVSCRGVEERTVPRKNSIRVIHINGKSINRGGLKTISVSQFQTTKF